MRHLAFNLLKQRRILLAQASTGSSGDKRRTSLQEVKHRCKIEHMSYAVKTFKYRLKPSKSQRTQLTRTLELCRWVFNETLATRKNSWEQEKKTLSRYDVNSRPMYTSDSRIDGYHQKECGGG